MGGQKKDHHSISTKTQGLQLVDTEGKLEALTPLPNITLWQSLRSYIQQFAEDHPNIYAGIIVLFAIALASLFILPIIAAAGRPQSNRTYDEFDPLPDPTPLTRWSPSPHHDDVAHTTPVPNLFLAQRDMTATPAPLPTLEEIQDLLNQRPNGYLVPVPEDSTLDLEGPLFNFSRLFNSTQIPSYAFNTIATATNFDSLYMLPGTVVAGGNWDNVHSNGTYAPGLHFTGAVSLNGVILDTSYLPGFQVSGINSSINSLWLRFSHALHATLSGTYKYLFLDTVEMPFADLSQAFIEAGSFMGLNMTESNLTGTQFSAVLRLGTIDATFFSNVRASGSIVCGLVLNQTTGWGDGIDGGLNLTAAQSCPSNPITIVNSRGPGLALSLRGADLFGATIVNNFFNPLDLRGTDIPDSAVMQNNTAIGDDTTARGGLTIFGGTRLSATSVRANNFGRAVCEPPTGECHTLPLPTECLDTTPDFYQFNVLEPECLPNTTLPNITLTTPPSTTTVPTTTSPGQNHTGPHHSFKLSALDFSFIAVSSSVALLLTMLASYSAYKHCKTQRSSLGRNRLGLHSDSASIQSYLDEETPLNPGPSQGRRAGWDLC